MKLFPKIAVGLFILIGITLFLIPKNHMPSFYDMPYMGYAAFACALVIFFTPKKLQVPVAVILMLNATGDLGLYELYKYGFEYDKIIHFVTPFLSVIVLTPLVGWKRAVAIVCAVAVAWELYEFFADKILKTHLFGVYRAFVVRDTITDLIMNILGITVGGLYLRHKKYGNTDLVD